MISWLQKTFTVAQGLSVCRPAGAQPIGQHVSGTPTVSQLAERLVQEHIHTASMSQWASRLAASSSSGTNWCRQQRNNAPRVQVIRADDHLQRSARDA